MHIYTVGHSTRTAADLCQLLSTYQVSLLADVRSFPRSRRNPQFSKEAFEPYLLKTGIRYTWLKKLGGRRKGLGSSSPNLCWENRSFRNFADYMETSEFHEGIQELIKLASDETVSIMCAEALYWKCHRSMIADFLKSEGITVKHILDATHSRKHEYTQCARIVDGKLTYHSHKDESDEVSFYSSPDMKHHIS